jgi:CDP-4-dehydro-6-deoxyglucose reductase, E3
MYYVASNGDWRGIEMSVGKMKARLVEKKRLESGFWWFDLEFEKEFEFEAGQYISVKVNEKGDRRAYSIATAPGGKRVGLLVDLSPGGIGSQFFEKLEVGETVEILGPLGRFVIEDQASLGLLFVATGSGVAPLRSMIEDLLKNKRFAGEVKLVWGLRFEKDVFWMKEFEELEKKYKNFKFELVLSKPGEGWQGKKGRVTDWIEKMKDVGGCEFYVCGSSEMVGDCVKRLVGKGVEEKKIHFEKYG